MEAADLLDVRMIQRRVKALATHLGRDDFDVRAQSMEDGSPHIEVGDAYYLVVRERGVELSRKKTSDLDELLYWIVEGLTWELAWKFEIKHRVDGRDSRRLAFAKAVELLELLQPSWADRQRAEQAEISQRHPFHDLGAAT